MTGQHEKAKKVIKDIYLVGDDAQKLENIYNSEKAVVDSTGGAENGNEGQATQITMKMALFKDERYVRSSWTAILIMAFQCLTGYYAIIAYSEVLLEEDFGDNENYTVRDGVFTIQAFNLLGSICSIYFISKVGRRTIFLVGQGGIAISLVGIAICSIFNAPVVLLTLICIIAFLFQLTLGPLAPLYAAEVCTDVALGAVMICEDVVVLLQDFVTPKLLSSPMQPVGVFFMFGAFSVFGLFYIYLKVPETVGLSEQEKREIFMPGAKYGRKLRPEEECEAGYEHRSELTLHMELFKAASDIINRHTSFENLSNRLGGSDDMLAKKFGFLGTRSTGGRRDTGGPNSPAPGSGGDGGGDSKIHVAKFGNSQMSATTHSVYSAETGAMEASDHPALIRSKTQKAEELEDLVDQPPKKSNIREKDEGETASEFSTEQALSH